MTCTSQGKVLVASSANPFPFFEAFLISFTAITLWDKYVSWRQRRKYKEKELQPFLRGKIDEKAFIES